MKIGICGKPSSGKSTFFSAATLVDVPRADYPFTTIKPNIGVTYATAKCVCKEMKVTCKSAKCADGVRLIPVTLVDVAGLVPDAHLGKGMGNEFLNDLVDADSLIHVVELPGRLNEKGEPEQGHDPEKDIVFLQDEIDLWVQGIIDRGMVKIQRNMKQGAKEWEAVYEQLAGLKMDKNDVKEIVEEGYNGTLDLARKIRQLSKPIILAGNKIDLPEAKTNYERLKTKYDITPVCSEAEFALRKANEAKLIKYVPGSSSFEVAGNVPDKQRAALEFIKKSIIDVYGSTGVQAVINRTVYEKLDYITVYPVEDEHKLTNADGVVLPDAYLMKRGSTALDLAFRVHTDIGKNFVGAIDCRTKRKVGKDYVLKDGDVISILSSA